MDINVSEGPAGTPLLTSSTGSFDFCVGDTVSIGLTGLTGATSYLWQAPTGTIIEGGSNTYSGTKDTVEVIIGSISGSFTATGSNDCNQSSPVASQSGTVNGRPVVSMNEDSVEVCDGDLVYLSASVVSGTSPYQYDWSGIVTSIDSNQFTSADSTYYVTVTDVNGCSSNTDSTHVVHVARPLAGNISIPALGGAQTQTICGGTPLNDLVVSGASGSTYQWISGPLDLQSGVHKFGLQLQELTQLLLMEQRLEVFRRTPSLLLLLLMEVLVLVIHLLLALQIPVLRPTQVQTQ